MEHEDGYGKGGGGSEPYSMIGEEISLNFRVSKLRNLIICLSHFSSFFIGNIGGKITWEREREEMEMPPMGHPIRDTGKAYPTISSHGDPAVGGVVGS